MRKGGCDGCRSTIAENAGKGLVLVLEMWRGFVDASRSAWMLLGGEDGVCSRRGGIFVLLRVESAAGDVVDVV